MTTPATVLSVTPSVTTVTDTNVGTAGDPGNPNAGFAVRITYSGPMNTNTAISAPTVTFTPAVAGTLTFNPAQSWWVSDTTYKAAFNVADANLSVAGISVAVAGASDPAGYDQARYHSPDLFNIDTTWAAAPAQTVSATPNLTLVSDLNVGADTFQVRLLYDKSMRTDTTPAITFTPDLSGTLTFDPAASWWISDNLYVAKYDVTDTDAIVPNVTIGATGRGTCLATTRRPPRSPARSAWTCSTHTPGRMSRASIPSLAALRLR